jgi:hypothetical protein
MNDSDCRHNLTRGSGPPVGLDPLTLACATGREQND